MQLCNPRTEKLEAGGLGVQVSSRPVRALWLKEQKAKLNHSNKNKTPQLLSLTGKQLLDQVHTLFSHLNSNTLRVQEHKPHHKREKTTNTMSLLKMTSPTGMGPKENDIRELSKKEGLQM